MIKNFLFPIIAFLTIMGCSTGPYIYNTGPKAYEDRNVVITPYIGVNIYSLMVENKRDSEMFIDFERMSVISPYGESRELFPEPYDNHIPPRSRIILECNQKTFSNEDPLDPFRYKNWDSSVNTYSGTYSIEKEIMEAHIGKIIRIFIPVIINGEELIYDISFHLDSIYQEN